MISGLRQQPATAAGRRTDARHLLYPLDHHFCAPAFIFFAGTSVFVHGRRHADLSRMLLLVAELSVLESPPPQWESPRQASEAARKGPAGTGCA